MGKTFWNLFIALINATLILAIICLWLAWKVLSAADRVSDQVAVASENIAASREDIRAMTTALGGLKSEVAALRTTPDPALDALTTRLDSVDERLVPLERALTWISVTPDELMDTAVRSAFRQAGGIVAGALVDADGAEDEPVSE